MSNEQFPHTDEEFKAAFNRLEADSASEFKTPLFDAVEHDAVVFGHEALRAMHAAEDAVEPDMPPTTGRIHGELDQKALADFYRLSDPSTNGTGPESSTDAA